MCTDAPCRLILGLLNIVVAIVGLCLVALSSIGYMGISEYDKVDSKSYVICMIFVACLLIVVPCFGFCGAWTGIQFLLRIYALVLIIVFFIQLAVTVLLFVALSESDFEEMFKNRFNQYWEDDHIRRELNAIQKALKCCGLQGPSFYEGKPLPSVCCSKLNEDGVCTLSNAFQKGCLKGTLKVTSEVMNATRIMSAITLLIEMTCVALAYIIIRIQED